MASDTRFISGPEGTKLELAHGPQTWLYRGGPRIEDLIPSRFRV